MGCRICAPLFGRGLVLLSWCVVLWGLVGLIGYLDDYDSHCVAFVAAEVGVFCYLVDCGWFDACDVFDGGFDGFHAGFDGCYALFDGDGEGCVVFAVVAVVLGDYGVEVGEGHVGSGVGSGSVSRGITLTLIQVLVSLVVTQQVRSVQGVFRSPLLSVVVILPWYSYGDW